MGLLSAMQGVLSQSAGVPQYALQTNGTDSYLELPTDVYGSIPFAMSWGCTFSIDVATTYPVLTGRGSGSTNPPAYSWSGDGVGTGKRLDTQFASSTGQTRNTRHLANTSVGETFRTAFTYAGSGDPGVYGYGTFNSAYNPPASTQSVTTPLLLGRLTTIYSRNKWRRIWMIDVELSGAQVTALDALIAANDHEGAASYLYGISTNCAYWPVGWPGDDATSGTGTIQDITSNGYHATPFNTDSADLVAVAA